MSENSLWYGYLEAGDKSSPVVLDRRLDTGNPKTVYIYNLSRREILEYRREIAEPKLRDLGPTETRLVSELKAGYAEAKRGFRPRGSQVASVPERARPAVRSAPQEEEGPEYEGMDKETEADEEAWQEED